MIAIPPKPKPKRRAVENEDIRDPIVAAINGLPGCWAAVNDAKAKQLVSGAWVRHNKLGLGSADVLFSCPWLEWARIGWIECKTKGRGKAERDAGQRTWAEAMRRKGHFVAESITTVAEAIAAVERCRSGDMR